MIYRDDKGLPVDQTMSGGDSSMRAGIGSIAGLFDPSICIKYETSPGWFVRHPTQQPSNNPLNFTRDQLTPLVAGLSLTTDGQKSIRQAFWKAVLRLGFAQDFVRDVPGSWKWPWPHTFYKDSHPFPSTYLWPDKAPDGFYCGSPVVIETKAFDFADPLGPAVFWHLIVAGRMWYFYWFGIFGVPLVILSIWGYHWSNETENNQIIAQCFVQGKWALNLFKEVNSDWAENLEQYWSSINETEYANAIKDNLFK